MGLFGLGGKRRAKPGPSSRIFEEITGLDEQWLEKPLFMELIKCAVILSDTKADVSRLGSADYLRENGLDAFTLHGPGAETILRGFHVEVDRLGAPGYMNDAIIRMTETVDRAQKMNDPQALQAVTGGLRMACIVFAQYILGLHPEYEVPLKDYLGAVAPALQSERNLETPDGLRESLLRAFACTVGLSWYPMDRFASDAFRGDLLKSHLKDATSSLAEALVVGGYFGRDAAMGEMVGGIDEVISGATLDLMSIAPIAFTLDAYLQTKDSGKLDKLVEDAFQHHMAAYSLLGGDIDRLKDDIVEMNSKLASFARQLDAARTKA